jgi:hypothetical protein
MRFWTAVLVAVLTLGVGGFVPAAPTTHPSPLVRSHPIMNQADCPAYSGGTGILADGDFSQAVDPGNNYPDFRKGSLFAPDWSVSKSNINFYGSTSFGYPAGYCAVDLDGSPGAGAIRHNAFATTKGEMYTVTFLFSGDGFGCYGQSPPLKTMLVKADAQFQTFTWNTADGNTAQNDDWGQESWSFQARGQSAVMTFRSEDPKASNCGPVVAAISVTQNSSTAAALRGGSPWNSWYSNARTGEDGGLRL